MALRMKMYGASDDLIEVEGIPGSDEFEADGGNDLLMGSFVVGGVIRVRAIYDGCWSFSVGQVDEDVPLPEWPISLGQHPECDYSALLEIEVPDHTTIVREA